MIKERISLCLEVVASIDQPMDVVRKYTSVGTSGARFPASASKHVHLQRLVLAQVSPRPCGNIAADAVTVTNKGFSASLLLLRCSCLG